MKQKLKEKIAHDSVISSFSFYIYIFLTRSLVACQLIRTHTDSLTHSI